MSCPFCGSKTIRIETPFVKASGDTNEYEPIKTFCCNAQKVNQEYITKNFLPDDAPDEEDVAKL